MSILGRPVSWKAVTALSAVLVVAALLPTMTTPYAREIHLVAKDMAFYVDGDPSRPNPTIEVKAGERVRIVLRNQDRGMNHDFAVPAAAAGTTLLKWNEEGEVVFEVPSAPGTYEYVCQPHQLMMRGTLRVLDVNAGR